MKQQISLTIRKYIGICTFLLLSSFLHAQEFQLKGMVTDDSTQQPVSGATVLVKKSGKATFTNSKGEFELPCSAGDAITVNYVGYSRARNALFVSINSGLKSKYREHFAKIASDERKK